MDIQVLGALAVCEGGTSIVPTAPKPRQVLALLALRADQVVPFGEFVEDLWGEASPGRARTIVQTYVMQLRDRIEAALREGGERSAHAKQVLSTIGDGYRLSTRGGAVDFHTFELRAGIGYRAMDAEDYRGAADRLRDALSLWSGPALADVRPGRCAARDVERLEQARMTALGRRIDADLWLGRHREVLPELTVLTNRFPADEDLSGQLALALYRSGRRGEALEACERLRVAVARERGQEPSSAFRELRDLITTAREPARILGRAG